LMLIINVAKMTAKNTEARVIAVIRLFRHKLRQANLRIICYLF